MKLSTSSALVWLRRDLRVFDHTALCQALQSHEQVWVVFVFDTDILSALLQRGLTQDRRVDFIWQSLQEVDEALRAHGGGLIVQQGRATELIPSLAKTLGVHAVLTHHDYEPAAIERDRTGTEPAAERGFKIERSFHTLEGEDADPAGS